MTRSLIFSWVALLGPQLAFAVAPGYTIPLLDLAQDRERQVIVDREAGQYLGHPTTVLLEDGKTMLCVYPKGHGRGGIVYKRSPDGGKRGAIGSTCRRVGRPAKRCRRSIASSMPRARNG